MSSTSSLTEFIEYPAGVETEHDDDRLDRISRKLDRLIEEVKKMTISQAQFDTDLAGLTAAETANAAATAQLVTDVDALIASKGAADLTVEDQAVQASAAEAATTSAALTAEIAKLNPTPAP